MTTPTPAAPLWPDVPDAERTIESLEHEYRVVGAKMHYDLEVETDQSDERLNAIVNPAHARQHEIMTEIARRRMLTMSEWQAALNVVRADTADDGIYEDVHRAMIGQVQAGIQDAMIIAKGGRAGEARAAIIAELQAERSEVSHANH